MDTAAEQLRQQVQIFIRQFGLLDGEHTPRGEPMATTHAHALMLMRDEAAGAHLAQLGALLSLDKSNVSRTVRALVRRGWVRLDADASDRRLKRAWLTRRGQRVAGEVDRASRRRFVALFARLTAAERVDVLRGLAAMNAALLRDPAPARRKR